MHNNLDPEKIEELLRNVPKINDIRSKEDIFARLKADGAFDEIVSQPNDESIRPQKKPLPFFKIASFVALFALVISVSTLIISNERFFNSLNDRNMDEIASFKAEIADVEDLDLVEDNAESMESYSITGMVRMADYRKGLYEDELVDESVFKIGLAGDAAESVPVSMKIPISFLNESGLGSDASYLQIYELVAPLLDEEALGFSEYHPFVGRLEEKGNQLIHYLPDDHSYDLASATISNYIGALNDTFGSHYEEVLLRTENGEVIEFSEIGEMKDPIVLNSLDRMNYFLFEQEKGTRYLSPNFRKEYATLTEAFATLKDEWNDVYKTAMIDEIDFDLENRGSYTAVIFKQPLDVTVYETSELMYMLEAIVATAASFGEQVKFENLTLEAWGGFWFTEVIPKLMGVNEISFPLQ